MSRRFLINLGVGASLVVALLVWRLIRGENAARQAPPASAEHANVVLITIDSLRYDRTGFDGYTARDLTPNLDAFAGGAVRYEAAYATASSTAASHASMMTSQYVSQHGVLTWNELPDSAITVADVLESRGYETYADVNLSLLSKQNLGQGFDHRREGQRDGSQIVERAVRFVEKPHDTAYFMWLHLYDVHRPYGGKSCETALRYAKREDCEIGADNDHYNIYLAGADDPVCIHSTADRGLDAADVELIEDRYDAGIRYTDEILAPLLEVLSADPRLEDTLVIVTADHGETLRDHPECMFTHDPIVEPAVTHVPLLVRYPRGRAGGTSDARLASLVDLGPTIVAAAGLQAPPTFVGRDLRAAAPENRVVYSEAWTWKKSRAARTLTTQVIEDPVNHVHRWIGDSDDDHARLLQALDELGQAQTVTPELDDDTMKQLESLGYLE